MRGVRVLPTACISYTHESPIFAGAALVTLLAKRVPSSRTSNAGIRVIEPVG